MDPSHLGIALAIYAASVAAFALAVGLFFGWLVFA